MSPAPPLDFELRERHGRLELAALHRPGYGAIRADWLGTDLRRRIAAGRRQLLARAVGLPKAGTLRVLDATGGLGRDAFTLAALGAHVTLVERNGLLVRLLEDARAHALEDPVLAAAAGRIEILEGDSRALMAGGHRWDAVYLDPMYPEDGKTALPSKEMQILRDLNGADADADALLPPARACAHRRVAVKRPSHAPWLAGAEPALSLRSNQLRFDIYW